MGGCAGLGGRGIGGGVCLGGDIFWSGGEAAAEEHDDGEREEGDGCRSEDVDVAGQTGCHIELTVVGKDEAEHKNLAIDDL